MNKSFWKAAGIRAAKTFCQTAVALIPAASMIQDVDWVTILSTAVCAGILSILTSIGGGLPEVGDGDE